MLYLVAITSHNSLLATLSAGTGRIIEPLVH